MKNKLQFMFSFVCLAIFASSISAQGIGDRNRPSGEGSYRIMGKVYLPEGAAAKGVTVMADSAAFSGGSAKTDDDGTFVISGLAAGNYNVTVRLKGYQNESEALTIAKGTTSGQSFQLVFHLRKIGEAKAAPKTSAGFADVPAKALAKYEEAMAHLTKEEAAKALPLLDQAIDAHPTFAAAYYEKGAAYLKLKDMDKAREAFVKAISIRSDYTDAKYGYGLASFGKKDYAVAEAAFRDVLKQKNDMAEAHLNLGMSLFHLKSLDEAQTELQSAVSMKGGEKLALGHLYLGQILMQKKKNADAAAELQKYLDLAPSAPNSDKIKTVIADLKKQS
jgi:tetratricopeptide (TPR) repeat protein